MVSSPLPHAKGIQRSEGNNAHGAPGSGGLRVALVVAPSHMGGLETVVSELLAAAQTSGVLLTCLALLPESSPLPAPFALLEQRGIAIVRIAAEHRAYHQHYRSLKSELVRSRVDLIHSHGYHADVLSNLLARKFGVPHVSTLHGFVGGSRRGRLYEWLQLTSLRRASAVIAVSETVAGIARARGVSAIRLHVIPNAAPAGDVLSRAEAREVLGVQALVPANAPLLGWIGRMSAEKDPLAFVSVMQELQRSTSAVGVMIGDGALMSEVRVAGAELIRSGQLLLAGATPDAGRLVGAFDALLLTSATEGTPMVALEAMRAGVPVVSTAVGGVPAMLAEDCGLLVPYGDTPAMCQAVLSLVRDASIAERLTDRARERVNERYSRAAWWHAHETLYASLVRAAGTGD